MIIWKFQNVLVWQTVKYFSTSQQLQVSAQHPQLHTCGGEPGVVSTEQKTVVKDSKV